MKTRLPHRRRSLQLRSSAPIAGAQDDGHGAAPGDDIRKSDEIGVDAAPAVRSPKKLEPVQDQVSDCLARAAEVVLVHGPASITNHFMSILFGYGRALKDSWSGFGDRKNDLMTSFPPPCHEPTLERL